MSYQPVTCKVEVPMTVRSSTKDSRTSLCAYNCVQVGPYSSKTQSGGNYTAGEPRGTPHPYSMSLSTTMTGYYGYMQWGEQFLAQVTPGLSIVSTGWTGADDNKLVNQLLEKMKLTDSSVGANIATGRQSIEMIGNRLFQLWRAARFVKKGDLRNATKTLFGNPRYKGRTIKGFSASGTVLEFNYGWSPLIADIYSASLVLQKSYRDSFEHVVRARRTVPDEVSTDPAFGFTLASSKTMKQIIAYLSVDPQRDLSARLGLTDYKSIAWEVVPFSFVVDWVLPIGDFLSLQHVQQRLQGTFEHCVTTKSFAVASGFGPSPPRPGGITPNIAFTFGSTRNVTVNRTIHSSLPGVVLPVLKPPFSFSTTGGKTRVLNAIALLGSLLGH